MNYRQIWENHNGPIPKDDEGFSFEIHHIDGDRKNEDISNLKLVTIREHLQIHIDQLDWGAAALIARRIGLGSEYMSELQRGKKRPGIGGVPKGTIPWNKGKRYHFSEEVQARKKGKRCCIPKISDSECLEIKKLFNSIDVLDGVGNIARNGKVLTRERLFAKQYCSIYNVTSNALYKIITGQRNVQIQS